MCARVCVSNCTHACIQNLQGGGEVSRPSPRLGSGWSIGLREQQATQQEVLRVASPAVRVRKHVTVEWDSRLGDEKAVVQK